MEKNGMEKGIIQKVKLISKLKEEKAMEKNMIKMEN